MVLVAEKYNMLYYAKFNTKGAVPIHFLPSHACKNGSWNMQRRFLTNLMIKLTVADLDLNG